MLRLLAAAMGTVWTQIRLGGLRPAEKYECSTADEGDWWAEWLRNRRNFVGEMQNAPRGTAGDLPEHRLGEC
jgi:hypothetical protein